MKSGVASKAGFFYAGSVAIHTCWFPAPFGQAMSRRRHALMALSVAAMPRHEYDEWR